MRLRPLTAQDVDGGADAADGVAGSGGSDAGGGGVPHARGPAGVVVPASELGGMTLVFQE